ATAAAEDIAALTRCLKEDYNSTMRAGYVEDGGYIDSIITCLVRIWRKTTDESQSEGRESSNNSNSERERAPKSAEPSRAMLAAVAQILRDHYYMKQVVGMLCLVATGPVSPEFIDLLRQAAPKVSADIPDLIADIL